MIHPQTHTMPFRWLSIECMKINKWISRKVHVVILWFFILFDFFSFERIFVFISFRKEAKKITFGVAVFSFIIISCEIAKKRTIVILFPQKTHLHEHIFIARRWQMVRIWTGPIQCVIEWVYRSEWIKSSARHKTCNYFIQISFVTIHQTQWNVLESKIDHKPGNGFRSGPRGWIIFGLLKGGLNSIPPPPRPSGSKSPRPMSLSGSIILKMRKITKYWWKTCSQLFVGIFSQTKYLGWTRSTSGVEWGRISGSGTGRRECSCVVVCVSDVFVWLSNAMTGSRSSRFKRFNIALTSGTKVNRLPRIDFTVSLIWSAVFVTWSGSPFCGKITHSKMKLGIQTLFVILSRLTSKFRIIVSFATVPNKMYTLWSCTYRIEYAVLFSFQLSGRISALLLSSLARKDFYIEREKKPTLTFKWTQITHFVQAGKYAILNDMTWFNIHVEKYPYLNGIDRMPILTKN